MNDPLHPLAGYQRRAVDGLTDAMRDVARRIEAQPAARRTVALRDGAMLLEAPTGSGKTLMLSRALEGAVGALPRKAAWFWFAPYAGLVAQTRDVLASQAPRLRLRDLASDRIAGAARDGDVWVQTWASVARSNPNTLRARQGGESLPSLDAMLSALRADGFLIGAVIDEAHLNFGASAAAAARFYLDVLQPDLTVLATATPNDDKLAAFERAAGVSVPTRITIARGEVVEAGLNKAGLTLGLLRLSEQDLELVDPEQATLIAGWRRHQAIKLRLAEKGVALTPLMLVQVEDQNGGEDPVRRVEAKLKDVVPAEVIKVHTSGEPDPDFHTFAYDPAVEILIFKVAVATGFDAPRAWTLVSVRPSRGREFGLQVVGRIMRVHPLVRPFGHTDALLDRGYVFLTDPELQAGLDAAAAELKAVRSGLTLVTDHLAIEEVGSAQPLAAIADVHQPFRPKPAAPADDAERQRRLELLIEKRILVDDVRDRSPVEQDRAIAAGEAVLGGELFDALPTMAAPARPRAYRGYPVNAALAIPRALWRERPLAAHTLNSPEFLSEIARIFCARDDVLRRLTQVNRSATLMSRDLFLSESGEEQVAVRMSEARIAERAQEAFQFNSSLDPRRLKPALVTRLGDLARIGGHECDQRALRRAIDLEVMLNPDALKEAIKEAQAREVDVVNDEPLPPVHQDESERPPARLAAYGVIPAGLNKPETMVARLLDADDTGTVRWWLRNQHNATWATCLLLPNGKRFFPDFVVCVNRRKSEDSIALIEVKDDGTDGRLHSDLNVIKIRSQHRRYRDVKWVAEGDGGMESLRFNAELEKIQAARRFAVEDLVG